MRRARCTLAPLLVAALFGGATSARAQGEDESAQLGLGSPFAPELREQYYQQLERHPGKAFGLELLLPGAGNLYTGLVVPAAGTLGASLVGAGLWIAGAVTHRDAMMWSGVGTFAAARAYGLVSAPIGAMLLNAAFRQQLGVLVTY